VFLFYLIGQMVNPSRRYRENPYEYQVGPSATIHPNQIAYAERDPIQVAATNLRALAIDPDDRLYVASDSALFVLSIEGHVKVRIEIDEPIHCLAAPDGKQLYVGFKNRIARFDYAGRFKGEWPFTGEESYLTSIAVSEKYVFAADAGQRCVWCYDHNGNVVRTFGEKDSLKNVPGFVIPSPYFDIVVDDEALLWAVNPGRHEIEQYNESGGMRTFWGEASASVEGFSGCCNPTHIALLSDGYWVTSEKGIPRVKLYAPSGEFSAVVAGQQQFNEDASGLDLAVDSQDRIFVLDPSRQCIRVFEKK
jgi:hypothetical protein